MAFSLKDEDTRQFLPGMSDRSYFAFVLAIFALIIVALLYASSFFMDNQSATYDTGRFYSMAKVIVSGSTPYLDYQDPKPPLIFFLLTLPVLLNQQFLGGLLLVGVCNLMSSALVLKIAWEYYGRFAGLAAGLLFVLNIGWAQGYFVMTEPFTILFMLLATYFALCGKDRHYLAAGACAGIAIGFKQYALIVMPLLLLALYLEKELKRAPAFLTGVVLPLFVIFGSIFFVYGARALDASMYWSFGVASPYVRGANIDGVISSGAVTTVELAANILIAVIIIATMALAVMCYARNSKLTAGDYYFFFSAVGFSLTLLIRQYLHYWLLALPFLSIVWAGWILKDGRRSIVYVRLKELLGHKEKA